MKRIIYCKVFIALLFTGWFTNGFSQISVVLTPPAPTQLTINNIFNFQVINNSHATYTAVIDGSLTLSSLSPVFKVQYLPVQIKPGVNVFSFANLQTSEQTYGNNDQANKLRTTGLIPYGSYVLCVNITDSKTMNILGGNCLEQQFGPNSPPQLLSPDNGAVVMTTNPLLTWLPPTPVQSNEVVNYDLKLAEVLNNESPNEALSNNPVLFYQTNITITNVLYPPNAYPLEIGHTYAWQIVAQSGGYSLGTTDVWRFTPGTNTPDSIKNVPGSGSYYKLKKTLDGSYAVSGKKLRFAFENKYDSAVLKYRITDMYGKDMTPKDVQPQRKYGDNRYELALNKANLKNGNYYMLEIFSSKNERQVMIFKYDKNFSKD